MPLSAIASGIGTGLSFRAAKRQMQFQERMDNTRYQRATRDMRAAGLNPAMMYSKGGGPGNAPQGAMAKPDIRTEGLSAVKLKQELTNMRAAAKRDEAAADQSSSASDLNRQAQARTAIEASRGAQLILNDQEVNRRLSAEADTAEYMRHSAQTTAFEADVKREFYHDYPEAVIVKDLAQSAEQTVRALNEIRELVTVRRKPKKVKPLKPRGYIDRTFDKTGQTGQRSREFFYE